jgi:OOP family OmpA-OmpF porin
VAAQAAGPGWYAGLGFGQMRANAGAAELTSDLAGLGYTVQATMDDSDTGKKVFGGYRLNPYLAIEASYVDLGKVSSLINASVLSPDALVADVSTVHPISIKGVGLTGIASYPIGNFSVFAKAGFVRWKATAQAHVSPTGAPSASVDEKGTHGTFGFGAGYDFPNSGWSVRGEWEKFKTTRNDPEFLSLSLLYRF